MATLLPASPSKDGRERCVIRSRGRERGRVGARGTVQSANGRFEAVTGWRIGPAPPPTLLLEDVFARDAFGERARMFSLFALERLREQRIVRGLPASRAGFGILFADELLQSCMGWTNEHIVLHHDHMPKLTMRDMYRYLASMLLSHTTRFSLEKTIDMLQNTGAVAPSVEITRFIANNVKGYSAMGRGDTGSARWVSQRDQTIQLASFERIAFHLPIKMFLHPAHTILTLDDDLYGTGARDNQVKTLRKRKADKEGHCADALADPFFRLSFMVRFRRRCQSQMASVDELLGSLLREQGRHSLHGLILTAGRGYGRMALVKKLMKHGIGILFVMPEHLLQCHTFVGESFLKVGRAGAEDEGVEGNGEDDDSGVDSDNSLTGHDDSFQVPVSSRSNSHDRPRRFVVNDS
jgi:hypothetical protein